MCGVAGVFKQFGSAVDAETLFTLGNIVAHRGPDDSGSVWMSTGVSPIYYGTPPLDAPWNAGLTHRRLSILDLSAAGHQPMVYLDRYWLTYNGEIYNYLELRTELELCGHSFRSHTDTEVILAAFAEWGPACFERFHGMWGIILVDAVTNQVYLCRDRMGIKPLYYWRSDDLIAVVSEIKQLTCIPGFRVRMFTDTVNEYLHTGYELEHHTFFRDVYPIAAGHWCQIDLNTLQMNEPKSYWHPERIQPSIKNMEEASRSFAECLQKSVQWMLRSDVPVGCALSGGLDSSAIVMLINRMSDKGKLHTFTSTFPGEAIDEREYVDEVLAHINAKPHFVEPTPERFLEDFDRFLWIHDEPVGGFSVYASYAVARLAREAGVPVTLNGQGGDELFAGYWQSYYLHMRDEAQHGHLLNLIDHFAGAMLPNGNLSMVRQAPAMLRRYMARQQPTTIPLRFSSQFKKSIVFQDILSLSGQTRRLHEIRYLHLPRLLKWDDRNSMAFSVEGRYPFLDHSVIELCLSFDASLLYHRGWTKWPLRVGLKGVLPAKISQRRSKFGFLTPEKRWLNQALHPLIQNWISQDRPLWTYLDHSYMKNLVQQVFESKWRNEELDHTLFRFFYLDHWMDRFNVSV
jgi:asparagine synthase (glutamine-hydrolysing)